LTFEYLLELNLVNISLRLKNRHNKFELDDLAKYELNVVNISDFLFVDLIIGL